jgi:hypothetical protein
MLSVSAVAQDNSVSLPPVPQIAATSDNSKPEFVLQADQATSSARQHDPIIRTVHQPPPALDVEQQTRPQVEDAHDHMDVDNAPPTSGQHTPTTLHPLLPPMYSPHGGGFVDQMLGSSPVERFSGTVHDQTTFSAGQPDKSIFESPPYVFEHTIALLANHFQTTGIVEEPESSRYHPSEYNASIRTTVNPADLQIDNLSSRSTSTSEANRHGKILSTSSITPDQLPQHIVNSLCNDDNMDTNLDQHAEDAEQTVEKTDERIITDEGEHLGGPEQPPVHTHTSTDDRNDDGQLEKPNGDMETEDQEPPITESEEPSSADSDGEPEIPRQSLRPPTPPSPSPRRRSTRHAAGLKPKDPGPTGKVLTQDSQHAGNHSKARQVSRDPAGGKNSIRPVKGKQVSRELAGGEKPGKPVMASSGKHSSDVKNQPRKTFFGGLPPEIASDTNMLKCPATPVSRCTYGTSSLSITDIIHIDEHRAPHHLRLLARSQ